MRKPLIFISHSKTDINFVTRIRDGLHHCKIQTWIDDDEIAHSESWLSEIFGSGLPQCDGCLAYLSPAAIDSKVVEKELDAAVLAKLKDKGLGFFPYVDSSATRNRLRPDLASLHCPEWNDENFSGLLPRVVAEIWAKFATRNTDLAVQSERVARLEAEKALADAQAAASQSVFTPNEFAEFEYAWDLLDIPIAATSYLRRLSSSTDHSTADPVTRETSVAYLLAVDSRSTATRWTEERLASIASVIFGPAVQPGKEHEIWVWTMPTIERLDREDDDLNLGPFLILTGMLSIETAESEGVAWPNPQTQKVLEYTAKFRRFGYWAHYHRKTSKHAVPSIWQD